MPLIKIEDLHPDHIDTILYSLWSKIEQEIKEIKELNPDEVEVRNDYLDTLFETTSLAFQIGLTGLTQLNKENIELLAKKEGEK